MEAVSRVPKIRFKADDGSEFPEWEEKRLGEIGSFKGGGTPNTSQENFWKGSTPWISSSDIDENDIYTIRITRHISDGALIDSATKIIPKGTVLIVSRVGIGKIALANCDLCTSQDFTNLIPDFHNAKFICYSFQSNKQVFLKYAQGTSIKGFTTEIIKKAVINMPSLPEQQKIANFLSTVDQKIETLTRRHELLQQYKKGMMQKLFAQEIRFRQDDGSEFPEWEEKRLGEISDVRDGTHDSPKYIPEGYPLVTSKNLKSNGKLSLTDINYISKEDFELINRRSKVDVGDILFGMIGSIGNPVRLTQSEIAIKNVALIKEEKTLKNSFLIHYLYSRFILKQFHKENTGGTQKFIALGIIRKLNINLPSLPEQQRIADFLSAIDQKIEAVSTQIDQMKTWKKGLLQKMFV